MGGLWGAAAEDSQAGVHSGQGASREHEEHGKEEDKEKIAKK